MWLRVDIIHQTPPPCHRRLVGKIPLSILWIWGLCPHFKKIRFSRTEFVAHSPGLLASSSPARACSASPSECLGRVGRSVPLTCSVASLMLAIFINGSIYVCDQLKPASSPPSSTTSKYRGWSALVDGHGDIVVVLVFASWLNKCICFLIIIIIIYWKQNV